MAKAGKCLQFFISLKPRYLNTFCCYSRGQSVVAASEERCELVHSAFGDLY